MTTRYITLSDVFTVEVTGPDRIRFLNGMLSNDVSKLEPGQGHFAVKATNKGRTQGLLRVRAGPDSIFLDLVGDSAELVAGALVQHLVADDCELVDRSDSRRVFLVLGASEGLGVLPAEDAGFVQSGGTVLIRDDRYGLAGFEVHVPDADVEAFEAGLLSAGATEMTAGELEEVRVLAGVPQMGRELDESVIPMEARLGFAIDYTKGCYIGQETIARATNLGGVKHRMVGLRFGDQEAALPAVDTKLFDLETGKDVGEVTSAVWSTELGAALGLGYVRVTHEAPGTTIRVGEGDGTASVTSLPHRPLRVRSEAFRLE
ncbi:MAG: glycine cleavage T C-terminal barrel domain-containing protein [Myxococcota bacterium]